MSVKKIQACRYYMEWKKESRPCPDRFKNGDCKKDRKPCDSKTYVPNGGEGV